MWPAVLLLAAALLYVIFPGDLDFIPVFGRLDDLLFVILALYYYRRRKRELQSSGGSAGRQGEQRAAGSRDRPSPGEGDPYTVLGVRREDDDETVKRAYRELLGRYHPDRVQHLGEEFREMAAEKSRAINLAWELVRKERNL